MDDDDEYDVSFLVLISDDAVFVDISVYSAGRIRFLFLFGECNSKKYSTCRDSLGSAMLCGASWESSFVAYEMCEFYYVSFVLYESLDFFSTTCCQSLMFGEKRGSHKVF